MEKFQNKYRIPQTDWQVGIMDGWCLFYNHLYPQQGTLFWWIWKTPHGAVWFKANWPKNYWNEIRKISIRIIGGVCGHAQPRMVFWSLIMVLSRPILNYYWNPIPSIRIIRGFAGNKNPMLNDNISRIIRWYKGRCSYEMRKFHADFAWQTRFYDHIIRNDESHKNQLYNQ